MLNLVLLLIAAALVQCSFEARARPIGDKKMDLDNSLSSNALPTPRRRLRNFVKLEPPPESVRHVAGTTTVLECGANSHPAPTVAWMRNGEFMSDFEEDSNEIVSIHPSSFAHLISKLVLTAPSNGDVYTCVATSGVIQKTASTTVFTTEGENTADALEQLFDTPAEPIITVFYDNVLQESGTNLLLPCRVSSFTKAEVYWQDNYGKLIYDSPRARVLPSGDLLLSNLHWDDMGKYTCTAKNMYGKDVMSTFLYPVKPAN